MGYPDQVSYDLAKYEQEQYDLDTKFDPADLSEVTQEEVDAFWDDMFTATKVKIMTCVKSEDWDGFCLTFREELIQFRKG